MFTSRRQDTNSDGVINGQDGLHLYTINLDSGVETQLTSGDHYDSEPSWSPDRRWIVFVSNREGNDDLYVIGADGSGLRRLTNTPGDERSPEWSPDGTQIAYALETRGPYGALESSHLHTVSLDGSGVRQLTRGPVLDTDPDWSPDGQLLAFERSDIYEGPPQVNLLEVTSGRLFQPDLPDAAATLYYDTPKWLPGQGSLLSLLRTRLWDSYGDFEIVVFDVEWNCTGVVLHQTEAIIEVIPARYTWGPNSEWLISAVATGSGVDRDEILASYEIVRTRIRLTGPSTACWQCMDSREQEAITANGFQDDSPDWAPW